MALIVIGNKFVKDLESSGTLGVYVPLEGGSEGRYQRRLRMAGYTVVHMTARGLGDLSSYLTNVHGVRPAHLGKKDIHTFFIPPILASNLEQLPAKSKGLVLWLIEGHILSNQEIEFLVNLPKSQPRVKIVVERGGDRTFAWKPLQQTLPTAS